MMVKACRVVGVAVVFLAAPTVFQKVARADIPMELLGVPSGNSMGNVYTSPYSIGVGANYTPTLLVCDDFTTDISFGQKWNANQYNIMQVTGMGPQKFQQSPNPVTFPNGGATVDYTIQQQYDAVAWLAEQLLDGAVAATSTQAAIDSYAIWQIFDPTAVDGYDGDALTTGAGSQQAMVAAAMMLAFSQTQLAYQIYIYTPDPVGASQEFIGIGNMYKTPQDFPALVGVPEGSTLAFLGFDSLALLGVLALVRRRFAQAA